MTILRLQPDDQKVLERTAQALEASHQVPKPPLRFRCEKCQVVLAEVGDVPGFGPLFASSWEVVPDEHRVVVNRRELKGREKRRWLADNYETTSQSGKPVDAPLRDGVMALLALPADMPQDYPDLLMRCDRHGDYIADRTETLKRLRRIRPGKGEYVLVSPGGEEFEYKPMTWMPGGERVIRNVSRRLRSKSRPMPTTVAELQARKEEQAAHLKRRHEQRDTPQQQR